MKTDTPQKYYIGIAAGFHDGAIALVNDEGEIIFAEATERFTQNKRSLSSVADNYFYIQKIVKKYKINDYEIAINWQAYNSITKHTLKALLNYCIRNYLFASKWFAQNIRKQNPDEYISIVDMNFTSQMGSLFMAGSSARNVLVNKEKLLYKKLSSFDHHLTHAYYGLYTSPVTHAVVLILDGNGDSGSSLSLYDAKQNNIKLLFRNKNNCSLGNYYGRITQLCGFDNNAGEQWKTMGLAPYGKLNKELLNHLTQWITVADIGIKYIDGNKIFEILKLFKSDQLKISKQDIAFTGQYYYETLLIKLVNNIYLKYPGENLIIAGGCALNSAANGKLHIKTPYKNIFISSAPADDGCAAGVALLNFKRHNPLKEIPCFQTNPYLGFNIEEEEIQNFLKHSGYSHTKFTYEELYTEVALHLKNGNIIAWVQGRAEFGPRALGNRSILANPALPEMKDKINAEVKFREEFRPFAPSVLEEHAEFYFEDYHPTPNMERVLQIKENKRNLIPAVTHVDGSGRLQTVSKETNLHYYNLINEFYKLSNVPIILNTSLNVMGKPIVNSVSDIAAVFSTSGIDILVINQYVFKKGSNPVLKKNIVK